MFTVFVRLLASMAAPGRASARQNVDEPSSGMRSIVETRRVEQSLRSGPAPGFPVRPWAVRSADTLGRVRALTLITVVFEADLGLLELQARSMRRYLDRRAVASVIVIDNTRAGMTTRGRRRLLSAYGDLAGAVRIIGTSDIVDVGGAAGWTSQQILKLAIADHVRTDLYMALDAKNFFVRPTGLEDFQDTDGRPRMGRHSYATHPLREAVARTLRFTGVDQDPWIDQFPVTHTPFVFVTDEVRAMRRDLETTHGTTLTDLFTREHLLEFPLYSAWLIAQDRLDVHYAKTVIQCPGVWSGASSADEVRAVLDSAKRREDVHLVSAHRRAVARMRWSAVRVLGRFLAEVQLADSESSAVASIYRLKVRSGASMVKQKMIQRLRRR